MKTKILTLLLCLTYAFAFSQVKVTDGPKLDNDRDSEMIQMIGGEDGYFYCYRILTKGIGIHTVRSYFIEKYDSKTMALIFSKEIIVDNIFDKLVGFLYAGNSVYIFKQSFTLNHEIELLYQTVSADGVVSKGLTSLMNIKTDYNGFASYKIVLNTLKTKIMVAVSHKANIEASYSTDFILYDTENKMSLVWKKTVNENLLNFEEYLYNFFTGYSDPKDILLGMMVDEKDNIFYSVFEADKNSKTKKVRYKFNLGILEAAADKPQLVQLNDSFFVSDIEFSKTANNEIVIGGFLNEVVEKKDKDLVNIDIFSYKVDIASKTVVNKTIKIFTPKLLNDLELDPKRAAKFKYKLDYIIPIGADVYYIGEQYKEKAFSYDTKGIGVDADQNFHHVKWQYEYMDVIIAKLNAKGEFEWITNVPMRNELNYRFKKVLMQYIAVTNGNSLYILRNDHPYNLPLYEQRSYDPRDLWPVSRIVGSSFIYSKIDLSNGTFNNELVFDNHDYCFIPNQDRIPNYKPAAEREIFVPISTDEIILYTEYKGKDKFIKLKFQ